MKIKNIVYSVCAILLLLLITGCGKDKYMVLCEKVFDHTSSYKENKISRDELIDLLKNDYNSACTDTETTEKNLLGNYEKKNTNVHCKELLDIFKSIDNGRRDDLVEAEIVLSGESCQREIEK